VDHLQSIHFRSSVCRRMASAVEVASAASTACFKASRCDTEATCAPNSCSKQATKTRRSAATDAGTSSESIASCDDSKP
jgi:hypothetical protein